MSSIINVQHVSLQWLLVAVSTDTGLTPLTVSDLELLESSLQNFSLRSLLSDYSHAAPDRMISLHNFVARSKYGDQLVPNMALIKKSEELLETAIRRLYPHYRGPA